MGFRRAVLALLLVGSCGDNEHAVGGAILISPQTGFYTDESGASTTFSVALSAPPLTEVVVTVTSQDTDEGKVSPRTLLFNASNFALAQTVTITGVDDPRTDGDHAYAVRVGTDLLGSFDLDVINGDDDVAGITVSPVVGLMTSEGGLQASFTARLSSQPFADVLVPITSSDPTEGAPSLSMLVFTPVNWDQPQTVTVTGAQDSVTDGAITYSIALGAAQSGDAFYDGLDGDDVQLVNADDDVFGIVVTPVSGLLVSEAGTQDTFSVALQTAPTANVTIAVATTDATEATASTASLVFTPTSWNTPQVVTVTGVDDTIDDGDTAFTITLGAAVSADSAYAGVDPADVTGSTTDNDTVGITVTPTAGLATTEGGGADSFTVRLDSQPTATVTIPVSSSDTTEASVSTASLVFTTANWMTAQTVTVTGLDDALTDGAQAYSIVLGAAASTDATYAGINPTDVAASNADNDVAGFTFDQATLTVSEFGDTDAFTIVLDTPPTANVTIALSSSNILEGTVSPASVTFTPQNWNVAQTVTVTGKDDAIADGNAAFTIITAPAVSTDAAYSGLNPSDVSATNLDNDTAQVYVKARNRLNVSETGQSSTFRVRLTIAPTATVTCTLFSSDLTEGTVSPTTLTFQPNGFGFQTVTVTGVDDAIVDGAVAFSIVLNACTSTDLAYQGSNPRDVAVLNRDND